LFLSDLCDAVCVSLDRKNGVFPGKNLNSRREFSHFSSPHSLSLSARECRADAANKLRADFYRFRVDAFHLVVVVVVVVSLSLSRVL